MEFVKKMLVGLPGWKGLNLGDENVFHVKYKKKKLSWSEIFYQNL